MNTAIYALFQCYINIVGVPPCQILQPTNNPEECFRIQKIYNEANPSSIKSCDMSFKCGQINVNIPIWQEIK